MPNPFTNNVSILIEDSFNEIYNIKVFVIIGKVRYQDTKISSKGLNIFEANLPQNLEEGVYFVQVKNSKGEIKIQKIVKQ